jgi:SAM-dependent methyltransferase
MGIYDRRVLPVLIDLVMRSGRLAEVRSRLLGEARGEVLEIGIGSGLNLPFYGPQVRRVIGIEPSAVLAGKTRRAAARADLAVEVLEVSAEALPLADASVDTAVSTWTLCSVPDPLRALREMRRVLRPGGSLIFVEHGLAPEPAVARWQRRLTPLWRRCAGGCHLDRPMAQLVAEAGFVVRRLETGYMAGPRVLTYLYEGRAEQRP